MNINLKYKIKEFCSIEHLLVELPSETLEIVTPKHRLITCHYIEGLFERHYESLLLNLEPGGAACLCLDTITIHYYIFFHHCIYIKGIHNSFQLFTFIGVRPPWSSDQR